MTKEKMKEEAKRRIDIMKSQGLFDEVVNEFDNDVIYYTIAMNLGVITGVTMRFSENKEFDSIRKQFERDYDAFVYMGILTETSFGRILSLIYVGKNEEEWSFQRRILEEECCAYAQCYNLDEGFGEIGEIGYEMAYGGPVRIR